eukprot:1138925-Pelagomonas_calceolata.AAC.5
MTTIMKGLALDLGTSKLESMVNNKEIDLSGTCTCYISLFDGPMREVLSKELRLRLHCPPPPNAGVPLNQEQPWKPPSYPFPAQRIGARVA